MGLRTSGHNQEKMQVTNNIVEKLVKDLGDAFPWVGNKISQTTEKEKFATVASSSISTNAAFSATLNTAIKSSQSQSQSPTEIITRLRQILSQPKNTRSQQKIEEMQRKELEAVVNLQSLGESH